MAVEATTKALLDAGINYDVRRPSSWAV